jgi:lysophospholipase L1-like esterase
VHRVRLGRRQLIVIMIGWVLLFTAIWFYQRSEIRDRELGILRLDPLGLQMFPEALPARSARRMVVVFGDSRAAEWPAPMVGAEVDYINRGIPAQTSAQVLGRYAAHVLPIRPDILVVQVGINDLKAIALFPGERDQIVAQCEANIVALVRAARASQITVILTTIIPAGEIPLEQRLAWSPAIDRAILQVNTSIRALAGERVLVLDAAPLLTDSEGLLRAEYQRDYLHLNARGYAVLNQELGALLLRIPE